MGEFDGLTSVIKCNTQQVKYVIKMCDRPYFESGVPLKYILSSINMCSSLGVKNKDLSSRHMKMSGLKSRPCSTQRYSQHSRDSRIASCVKSPLVTLQR